MNQPRIMVILYREDDPGKNTALKLIKMGLATRVSKSSVRGYPIVLNPYSNTYLGPWHREQLVKQGLLVLDASWRRLSPSRFKDVRGLHTKLPPLLPGNPVNYGKPCILSSIEAVAAALYITGLIELYSRILGLYKWMKTFHDLNKELLQEYSKTRTPEELEELIIQYWETKNPCIQVEGEGAGT
jgi:pre-rRNA-processing protein TSR3